MRSVKHAGAPLGLQETHPGHQGRVVESEDWLEDNDGARQG